MSSNGIHADVVLALAGVASGRVYPDVAPQDYSLPLVIYSRVSEEPLLTLAGYGGMTKSTFRFDCWGMTKQDALTTAEAVVAALESASGLPIAVREPASGEDVEPALEQFTEPVQFSFWHE